MKRFYYAHLYMPLRKVWDFLFPVCFPLNFDITTYNLFEAPRRPFPLAWTVRGCRSLLIQYYRLRARMLRGTKPL